MNMSQIYSVVTAVLLIIFGLYFIIGSRRFTRHNIRQLTKTKNRKNFENFQRLKKMNSDRSVFNVITFMFVFIGAMFIMMHIPTFFPKTRPVIVHILAFCMFSFFSIGGSALVIGTVFRRLLFKEFKEIEKHNCNKEAFQRHISNGRDKYYSESRTSEAENDDKNDDPIVIALRKKGTVKLIIFLVIFYIIFMFSFYKLVGEIK